DEGRETDAGQRRLRRGDRSARAFDLRQDGIDTRALQPDRGRIAPNRIVALHQAADMLGTRAEDDHVFPERPELPFKKRAVELLRPLKVANFPFDVTNLVCHALSVRRSDRAYSAEIARLSWR